jgi:hypothetical protein
MLGIFPVSSCQKKPLVLSNLTDDVLYSLQLKGSDSLTIPKELNAR